VSINKWGVTYINIIVVVFIKIARNSKACAKTKLRLEYCTLLIAEIEKLSKIEKTWNEKECVFHKKSDCWTEKNNTISKKKQSWEHAWTCESFFKLKKWLKVDFY